MPMQLQLQPELEGTLERGALLRADGDALAAQRTRPARAELALNPSRFESWEMYAGKLTCVRMYEAHARPFAGGSMVVRWPNC